MAGIILKSVLDRTKDFVDLAWFPLEGADCPWAFYEDVVEFEFSDPEKEALRKTITTNRRMLPRMWDFIGKTLTVRRGERTIMELNLWYEKSLLEIDKDSEMALFVAFSTLHPMNTVAVYNKIDYMNARRGFVIDAKREAEAWNMGATTYFPVEVYTDQRVQEMEEMPKELYHSGMDSYAKRLNDQELYRMGLESALSPSRALTNRTHGAPKEPDTVYQARAASSIRKWHPEELAGMKEMGMKEGVAHDRKQNGMDMWKMKLEPDRAIWEPPWKIPLESDVAVDMDIQQSRTGAGSSRLQQYRRHEPDTLPWMTERYVPHVVSVLSYTPQSMIMRSMARNEIFYSPYMSYENQMRYLKNCILPLSQKHTFATGLQPERFKEIFATVMKDFQPYRERLDDFQKFSGEKVRWVRMAEPLDQFVRRFHAESGVYLPTRLIYNWNVVEETLVNKLSSLCRMDCTYLWYRDDVLQGSVSIIETRNRMLASPGRFIDMRPLVGAEWGHAVMMGRVRGSMVAVLLEYRTPWFDGNTGNQYTDEGKMEMERNPMAGADIGKIGTHWTLMLRNVFEYDAVSNSADSGVKPVLITTRLKFVTKVIF